MHLILRLLVVSAVLVMSGGAVASAAPSRGSETAGSRSGKIINGTSITPARQAAMWPFLVSVGTKGQGARAAHYCGGALIHPRLVLTAAHCVDEYDAEEEIGIRAAPGSATILAGTYALSAEKFGQRRIVRDVFVHPGWNPEAFINDIAVLRLAAPITPTARVKTIPVISAEQDVWWGAGAGVAADPSRGPWSAGWGNVTAWDRGEAFPNASREVLLPVVADDACATTTEPGLAGLPGGIDMTRFVCAGVPDSDADPANGTTGSDTCQGDSGGPLVVGDGAGAWSIFGVVSYGDKCGATTYGAYTRLAFYRDWIASIAPIAGGPGGINAVPKIKVAKRGFKAVTLAWNAPKGGAASYVLYLDIGEGGIARYGTTRRRVVNITRLDPGTRYGIYIAARDSAGNESPMRRIVAATLG